MNLLLIVLIFLIIPGNGISLIEDIKISGNGLYNSSYIGIGNITKINNSDINITQINFTSELLDIYKN